MEGGSLDRPRPMPTPQGWAPAPLAASCWSLSQLMAAPSLCPPSQAPSLLSDLHLVNAAFSGQAALGRFRLPLGHGTAVGGPIVRFHAVTGAALPIAHNVVA